MILLKSKNFTKNCYSDNNKLIYYLGIIGSLVLGIGYITIKVVNPQLFNMPCILNITTGYYCPGCGGTRAVKALLHGNIIKSIKYNFFATYIVILYFVFMISQTISVLSKGKVKGFDLKPLYMYLAIVLLAVNFIIRNLLLVMFKIEIG